MDIVAATRNQGKLEEIRSILSRHSPGIRILGLDSFPGLGEIPEPGSTFEENALHKARTVAGHTGLISLADDSGLEVDALEGEPGVYSARYSGPGGGDQENIAKLLRRLGDSPSSRRTARFRCVLAACSPEGAHLLARGSWQGRITDEPAGSGGFGYDPVFLDPELGLTAAQMQQQEKNSRSHRSKALQELAAKWPEFLQQVSA